MKPLYVPKGRAREYGDYAVNIYTGCPHRCYYCFAPNVLHRGRRSRRRRRRKENCISKSRSR